MTNIDFIIKNNYRQHNKYRTCDKQPKEKINELSL